ncbi:MAG TPA: cytochrome c [Caulobacteraceae bacterium]|nr:cytochrome c [Caulobacteraceae bacterium]
MSSPFRTASLALVLLALGACDRERRDLGVSVPESGPVVTSMEVSPRQDETPPGTRGYVYEASAFHVATGSQLYRWYNCNGCHANGGGGMGPPLIDREWRYGSSIDQIYATIRDGRPNGMPGFEGKATDQQMWQLAAYVRSLGGFTPQASSARREAMRSTPPRNQAKPQEPRPESFTIPQGVSR